MELGEGEGLRRVKVKPLEGRLRHTAAGLKSYGPKKREKIQCKNWLTQLSSTQNRHTGAQEQRSED